MVEVGNAINSVCLHCKTCLVILFFFEHPLNFGRCGRVSDSKKNSNGVHIKCVDDTTRWDYKYIDRFRI